ncbi:translation initiation factor [Rariglobus hedericola]|uniref:Translation initiation factor n=1 Tax=Rariglobus hedericola TaxID=2597822 RepID=A0A556QLL2_9BACT|nr:translation initiation factor [Rariglobus hedericola]TSJ77482.1 translation initiation factor [Rariglobus hedericola]
MSKDKISTDGGQNLGQNPFGGLGGLSFPAGNPVPRANALLPANEAKTAKNRGRVEVLRMTAGRGGKTVTVARAFVGIGLPEKEQLAKKIQKACGSGGTVKDGQIEIQGDQREVVARVLTEAGFRPVMAGG